MTPHCLTIQCSISENVSHTVKMPRLLRLSLLAALLGAIPFTVAAPLGAQLPPGGSWRTIESPHFRVTYQAGLDALAGHAAERAEVAHARLRETLTRAPAGKVDLVLTDNVDFTNGYATPFPSNRIVIYARPPVDVQGLDYYRDWMELVITHELTHIFHLDRAGRLGMALRTAFGRLPLIWPLFPAVGTPSWSIEGLATHVESDFTGAGRVHGSYHDMIVRTAVLEERFDPFSRTSASSPIWPGNERVYIYGSLFLDHLAERYGEEVRGRIIDKTASAAIPPVLWFGGVGRRTIGKSFGQAYSEWHQELRVRYGRLADSLRAQGLTEPERITTHGRHAIHPRVSPDGRHLAYAAQVGREVSQTRIIELATGRTLRTERRNGLGAVSWFPRGESVAFSQLEFGGPYHLLQDLYAFDEGRQIRLTERRRLQDPDVDRHGELLVAVENGGGTNRLIIFRNSERATRVLVDFDPAVQWALPRWSPEGDRIAAGRWTQGGEYDVVVLDTLGRVLTQLTDDRAIDGAPAWSPDERYIVFSSDRTGIPNLYAADLSSGTPTVMQVTNVLGGALYPDVSPDGQWIYFSDYHSDGYHISRIAFDPSTWRPLPPLRIVSEGAPGSEADGSLHLEVSSQTMNVGGPHGYSPWQSLLPKFWLPLGYTGEVDSFIGAASAGSDLLGRHAWFAFLAVDPDSKRWEGEFDYSFAGLGNPILGVEFSRAWDRTFGVIFPDSSRRAGIASEDALALVATMVRRRFRSTAALTLGVEGVLVRREIVNSPVPGARHPDERDELFGVLGRIGYANYVVPSYAISREDGISVSLAARRRTERDPFRIDDQQYDEVSALASAYKSIGLPGFTHHVFAVRGGALIRDGGGLSPTSLGGAPGGVFNALGVQVAGGSQLLPLRGFERGVRRGTRAWSASAEHRIPIALIGRRPSLSPIFIDRLSTSLFVDAGDAWCSEEADALFTSCDPRNGGATGPRRALIGAGAEFVIDAALASIAGGRFRLGVGFPVRGPQDGPVFHVQVGSAF
jgi:Tol biopolymer transport system component